MPYKNCILLELYMSLRVGEALALQISDINLQRNIISMGRILTTDINNQICIGWTPKTYASQRELPIHDFMRDFIINNNILNTSSKFQLSDSINREDHTDYTR